MAIFDDDTIIKNYQKLITSAQEFGWSWWKRNEYIEGRRFFDGIEQYDSDVLKSLGKRGLRPVVMNRTDPFIRGVANNIGKATGVWRYYPLDDVENQPDQEQNTEKDDYSTSMNELGKWGRDQGNFEREAGQVRLDASICGVGIMEQRLDMEGDNVFGEPCYTRIPPIEVVIDQDAQGVNFHDARDMFRARIMDKETFTEQFEDSPGAKDVGDGIDQMFTMLQVNNTDSITINPLFESTAFDSRLGQNNVTVYDYQWFQKEAVHVVKNPLLDDINLNILGQDEELLIELRKLMDDNKLADDDPSWLLFDKEFRQLEGIIDNKVDIESAKKKKKRYYRAFIAGDIILDKMESPFPDGFTYSFYTQYYDEDKRVPYGFMRKIKDSQRTSNASFLHMFHSILSAPKPSMFAEHGVTDEPDKFELQAAQRDSVLWVNDGKLERIRENIPPTVPTGFENPLQISIESMFQVTGLNFEMLGQQTNEISGILDKQRTERGYDMLKDVIDNYRMFLKEIGKKDLQLYREIASQAPGEIIRVIGTNGIEAIPLLKDQTNQNFAVTIDDAPSSINQKSDNIKVLFDIMQLPNIPPQMQPMLLDAVLENSDMPSDLRRGLQRGLTDATTPSEEERAQQAQQQQQILQQQLASQQAQDELVRANTIEKEGEAIKDAADAKLKEAQEVKVLADTEKVIAETQEIQAEMAGIIPK